jgi:hypothetical protein
MLRFLIFVSAGFIPFPLLAASSRPLEITVNMKIDVDGAPNAYAPKARRPWITNATPMKVRAHRAESWDI